MHNMKRTHKIKLLNLWNQRKNYETKILKITERNHKKSRNKNGKNHGMKPQKNHGMKPQKITE